MIGSNDKTMPMVMPIHPRLRDRAERSSQAPAPNPTSADGIHAYAGIPNMKMQTWANTMNSQYFFGLVECSDRHATRGSPRDQKRSASAPSTGRIRIRIACFRFISCCQRLASCFAALCGNNMHAIVSPFLCPQSLQ